VLHGLGMLCGASDLFQLNLGLISDFQDEITGMIMGRSHAAGGCFGLSGSGALARRGPFLSFTMP
jgi:hypothetical protein